MTGSGSESRQSSLEGQRTLADLDKRLAWTRADVAENDRLTARLERSRRQLAVIRARIGKLSVRVERERQDVDDFAGTTLSAVVEQLFGDLEARREKELAEWLVARLRLEQAQADQSAMEAEVVALERRLATDADPREAYHKLLADKSRWLEQHGGTEDDHRTHLAERVGVLSDALRELDEAHWAGQVAKAALMGLLNALGKAQALGKLDMIGLASNWVKYEHLDDAHRHASSANRALSRFQMELADVQARHDANLTMEIGQLATFADFFLDDLVSDWVVQCRINRSHSSAGIARTRVSRTLRAVTGRRHEVLTELKIVRQQLEGLEGD